LLLLPPTFYARVDVEISRTPSLGRSPGLPPQPQRVETPALSHEVNPLCGQKVLPAVCQKKSSARAEERFQNPSSWRDHVLLLPACEGFHAADLGVCPAERRVVPARQRLMSQERKRKVGGKQAAPQQQGSETDSHPSQPLHDAAFVKQKQRQRRSATLECLSPANPCLHPFWEQQKPLRTRGVCGS